MIEAGCVHEELNCQPSGALGMQDPSDGPPVDESIQPVQGHPPEITACHYPMDFAIELFPNVLLTSTFH